MSGHSAAVRTLAFSPDGKVLASGSNDTTALLWSVTDVFQKEALPVNEPEPLWQDLRGGNGPPAWQAIVSLAAGQEKTIAFLKDRLEPAKEEFEAARVRRLVTDLDSDQFSVREAASEALKKIGAAAQLALEEGMKRSTSLEAHRRMEALLEALKISPLTPDELRAMRAVQVLEQIGTPEARQVLERLAKGAPAARLTREARGSLDRLDKRAVCSPQVESFGRLDNS